MIKKFACVLTLLLVGGVGLADDFAPPEYRGSPLSAEVQWEFSSWTGGTNIPPDLESYVDDSDPGTFLYDKFTTHIDLDSINNWTWVPGDGDGGLQAATYASFACNVINWVDEMPEKLLRIQITYIGDLSPTIRSSEGYAWYNPASTYATVPLGRTDVDPSHFYEDFAIYPNPEYEQIIVDVPVGTIIDQIYIDTVSLPEPGTMVLLGAGGLILLRRRCRRA